MQAKVVVGKDYFQNNAIIWGNKIAASVANDFGDDWSRAHSITCKVIGVSEGAASKNTLLINLTLANLANAGKFSGALDKAIDGLLAFGKTII